MNPNRNLSSRTTKLMRLFNRSIFQFLSEYFLTLHHLNISFIFPYFSLLFFPTSCSLQHFQGTNGIVLIGCWLDSDNKSVCPYLRNVMIVWTKRFVQLDENLAKLQNSFPLKRTLKKIWAKRTRTKNRIRKTTAKTKMLKPRGSVLAKTWFTDLFHTFHESAFTKKKPRTVYHFFERLFYWIIDFLIKFLPNVFSGLFGNSCDADDFPVLCMLLLLRCIQCVCDARFTTLNDGVHATIFMHS